MRFPLLRIILLLSWTKEIKLEEMLKAISTNTEVRSEATGQSSTETSTAFDAVSSYKSFQETSSIQPNSESNIESSSQLTLESNQSISQDVNSNTQPNLESNSHTRLEPSSQTILKSTQLTSQDVAASFESTSQSDLDVSTPLDLKSKIDPWESSISSTINSNYLEHLKSTLTTSEEYFTSTELEPLEENIDTDAPTPKSAATSSNPKVTTETIVDWRSLDGEVINTIPEETIKLELRTELNDELHAVEAIREVSESQKEVITRDEYVTIDDENDVYMDHYDDQNQYEDEYKEGEINLHHSNEVDGDTEEELHNEIDPPKLPLKNIDFGRFDKIETENLKTATLGLPALKVGYRLRNNLINFLGFVMQQGFVPVDYETFEYLRKLKEAIQLNEVDVFRLIPIVAGDDDRDEKARKLFAKVDQQGVRCNVQCAAKIFERDKMEIKGIMKYVGYDILTNGLEPLAKLRTLADALKVYDRPPRELAEKVFGPAIVKILKEVLEGKECLSEEFFGFLLPFYPWPGSDFQIRHSVFQISETLIQGGNFLGKCRFITGDVNSLAGDPYSMLKEMLLMIADSGCASHLRGGIRILYENVVRMEEGNDQRSAGEKSFIELKALDKLLDHIDFDSFPTEMVLNKLHVQKYFQKYKFRFNGIFQAQIFTPYLFRSKPTMLVSLLSILEQQPWEGCKEEASSLIASLLIQEGSKPVTSQIVRYAVAALRSPDLSTEFLEKFGIFVSKLLGDSLEENEALIQKFPRLYCTRPMDCFYKYLSLLEKAKGKPGIYKRRLSRENCLLRGYLKLPPVQHETKKTGKRIFVSILEKFVGARWKPVTPAHAVAVSQHKHIADIYTLQSIIAAEKALKAVTNSEYTPGPKTGTSCLKQEELIAYCEDFLEKHLDVFDDVKTAFKVLIADSKFLISSRKPDLNQLDLIRDIYHGNARVTRRLEQLEPVAVSNEHAISEALLSSNFICREILDCLRHIEFTVAAELGYAIELIGGESPTLARVGFADLSQMSAKTILEIGKKTTENFAEQVGHRYIAEHEKEIDAVVRSVNCENDEFLRCFEKLTERILYDSQALGNLSVGLILSTITPFSCSDSESLSSCEPDFMQYPFGNFERVLMDLRETLEHEQSLHAQINLAEVYQFYKYGEHTKKHMKKVGEKISRALSTTDRVKIIFETLSRYGQEDISYADSIPIKNLFNYYSKGKAPTAISGSLLVGLMKVMVAESRNPRMIVEWEYRSNEVLRYQDSVNEFLTESGILYHCTDPKKAIGYVLPHVQGDYFTKKLIRDLLTLPDVCRGEGGCDWLDNIIGNATQIPNSSTSRDLKALKESAREVPQNLSLRQKLNTSEDSKEPNYLENPKNFEDTKDTQDKEEIDYTSKDGDDSEKPEDSNVGEHSDDGNNSEHKIVRTNQVRAVLAAPIPNFSSKRFISLLHDIQTMCLNELEIQKIQELLRMVERYPGRIDDTLSKEMTPCRDTNTCVWSIHNTILEKNLMDDDFFAAVVLVLRAPECPATECPYKLQIHPRMIMNYQEMIVKQLRRYIVPKAVAFHLKMDVEIIINFLVRPGYEEYIPVDAVHQRNSENSLRICFEAMLLERKLPRDVALCVKNFLEFVYEAKTPDYINAENLVFIVGVHLSHASDFRVGIELQELLRKLLIKREDVTDILQTINVNCLTYSTCIRTIDKGVLKIKEEMATLIREIMRPNSCKKSTCPWIKETVRAQVKDIKGEMVTTIDAYIKTTSNLLLKFDFVQLKKIVEIEDVLDSLLIMDSVTNDYQVIPFMAFITTLDQSIIVKHDFEDGWYRCLEFVISGVEPRNLDYRSFIIITNMLKGQTEDVSVRKEIDRVIDILKEHESALKMYFKTIQIFTCDSIKEIVEAFLDGVYSRPDDPLSTILINLFTPNICTVVACPWITVPTATIQRLEKVKSDLLTIAHSNETNLIISMKIFAIMPYLKSEAAEQVMERIKSTKTTKEFLKILIKEHTSLPKEIIYDMEEILKTLGTKSSVQLATIKTWDLHHVIQPLQKVLSQNFHVQNKVENLDKIILRYSDDVQLILKDCKITCPNLSNCMKSLYRCAHNSTNPAADYILSLVEMCPVHVCPWIKAEQVPIKTPIITKITDYQLNGNKPSNLIIFPPVQFQASPITLSLYDRNTVERLKKLESNFSQSPAGVRTYVDIPTVDGATTTLSFDFTSPNIWPHLFELNTGSAAEIDLRRGHYVLILVPTDDTMRAIKLNVSDIGIKSKLREMARSYQLRAGKPTVTLVDYDGSRIALTLDFDDDDLSSDILAATVDKVQVNGTSLIFWPAPAGQPWKCLAADGSNEYVWKTLKQFAVEQYGSGSEYVRKTKHGVTVFSFNVFDDQLVNLLNFMWNKKQELVIRDGEQYVFYVPYDIVRLVGVNINLMDETIIRNLVNLSDMYSKNLSGAPTLELQNVGTANQSIELFFNFQTPQHVSKFLEAVIPSPDVPQVGVNFKHLIILPLPDRYVFLLPDVQEVSELLMEMGTPDAEEEGYTLVNVPVGDRRMPLGYNLQDPVVISVLESLMQRTLVPFPPIRIQTNEKWVICFAVAEGHIVSAIIFEETQSNYRKVFRAGQISQEVDREYLVVVPFAINEPVWVDLQNRKVLEIFKSLPPPYVKGIIGPPSDDKTGPTISFPVPNEDSFDVVHISIGTDLDYQYAVKLCTADAKTGVQINIPDQTGAQHTHFCDFTNKTTFANMKEKIYKVSRFPPKNSIVILPLERTNGAIIPFLLDLSEPKIRERLRQIEKIVSPTSLNKVSIFYVNHMNIPETFILDIETVSDEVLIELNRFVSANIVPTKLTNPFAGRDFIVMTVTRNKVVDIDATDGYSILLNQDNSVVTDTLDYYNAPGDPEAAAIVLDEKPGYPVYVKYVNFHNNVDVWTQISNHGHNLTSEVKLPLINQDPMLIIKIVDLHGRIFHLTLNTTDSIVRTELLEISGKASKTVPITLLRGAYNNNYAVRLDLKNQQVQRRLKGLADKILHAPSANSMLILKPNKDMDAISLDLTLPDVVEGLLRLAEANIGRNGYLISLTDLDGNPVIISIDIYDVKVIGSLKLLAELTAEKLTGQEVVLVPSDDAGNYILIMNIFDSVGRRLSLSFDLKAKNVLEGLVALSVGPSPGNYRFDFEDLQGSKVVLYLDVRNPGTLNKLKTLSKMSNIPNVPLYNPPTSKDDNSYSIEVPYMVTYGGVWTIKCDAAKPNLIKNLLSVSDSKTYAGTPYFITDPSDNEMHILQFNLSEPRTLEKIKRVCIEMLFRPKSGSVIYTNVDGDKGRQNIVISPRGDSVDQELQELAMGDKYEEEGVIVKSFSANTPQRFYKLDKKKPKTKRRLLDLYRSTKTVGTPIIISTDIGKVMILTINDNTNDTRTIALNLDNSDLVSELEKLDTPSPKASKLIFKQSNGRTIIIHVDLSNPEIIGSLQMISEMYEEDFEKLPKGSENVILDENGNVVYDTKKPIKRVQYKIGNIRFDARSNQQRPFDVPSLPESPLLALPSGSKLNRISNDEGDEEYEDPEESDEFINDVDSSKTYLVDPSSIVMIAVQEKRQNIVMLFDLYHDGVFNAFLEMSAKVNLGDATHLFTVPYNDYHKLIKVDTRRKLIVKRLMELSKSTAKRYFPMEFPNSCAPGHYIVFTVIDPNKENQAIVLDATNAAQISKLKSTLQSENHPSEIIRFNIPPNFNVTVDVGDQNVVEELIRMTQSSSLCSDALKNVPVTNAIFETSIYLPIPMDNGTEFQYRYRISDKKSFREVRDLSATSPRSKPAVVVYVQGDKKMTVPLRINLQTIQGTKAGRPQITTAIDPLVFFIDIGGGRTELIILDRSRHTVIQGLNRWVKEKQERDTKGRFCIFNIIHPDGHPMEIKLNLTDPSTVKELRRLQNITFALFTPFTVKTLFGPEEVLITQINVDGKIVPVIFNPNRKEFIAKLRTLLNVTYVWDVKQAFEEKSHLITNDIARELLEMSYKTPIQEVPSLLHYDFIYFTIIDEKDDLIRLLIDTGDQNQVSQLVELSLDVQEHGQNVWLTSVVDQRHETMVLIKIDHDNARNTKKLKELSKYTVYPSRHKITPPTGHKDLLVYSIPRPDVNANFTLDPNSEHILQSLEHDFNVLPTTITPKINFRGSRGTKINVPFRNESYLTLSDYSPFIVNPITVVPPNGRGALLSLMVPTQYGDYACVTINVNDEEVFEKLEQLKPDKEEEVTYILFYEGEHNLTTTYLDLTDRRTIRGLQDATMKSPIRIIPRRNKYPLLKLYADNGEDVVLDVHLKSVKDNLMSISRRSGYSQSLTEIELRDADGLMLPIWLPIIDPETKKMSRMDHYQEFKKYTTQYEVPEFYVRLQDHEEALSPKVRIMPARQRYPIMMLDMRTAMFNGEPLGDVTIDLNQPKVMELVQRRRTDNTVEGRSLFEVQDVDGNIFAFSFDFSRRKEAGLLREIHGFSAITFRSSDVGLPTICLDLISAENVQIDLNNPEIVSLLIERSQVVPGETAYKLQIPDGEEFLIIFVDFNDEEVLEGLQMLSPRSKTNETEGSTSKARRLSKFEFPDALNDTWEIILDITDYWTLEELKRLSEDTAEDEEGYRVLTLSNGIGDIVRVVLNRYDPNTVARLKLLTEKTTGAKPNKVSTSEPKVIRYVRHEDDYGRTNDYAIDVNNKQVMKNLLLLQSWVKARYTKIALQLVTMKRVTVRLDFEDPDTKNNLDQLTMQSLYRQVPHFVKPSSVQRFLDEISVEDLERVLTIDTFPTGRFSVVYSFKDAGIINKLLKLNSKELSKSLVQVDVSDGTSIYVNPNDPNTLKELVVLSSDTKGDKNLILSRFRTIKLTDSDEEILCTIDTYREDVIRKLEDASTEKGVEINYVSKFNVYSFRLDINKSKVQNLLKSVSTPTISLEGSDGINLVTVLFPRYFEDVIVMNLSNKAEVLKFIGVAKDCQSRESDVDIEVKDESSQYLYIPINLNELSCVNDVRRSFKLYKKVVELEITDRRTYLSLVVPKETNYWIVKLKLDRQVLRRLTNLNHQTINSVQFKITDHQELFEFRLDLARVTEEDIPELIPVLSQVLTSYFIIYTGNENFIYLNLENPKVIEYLAFLDDHVQFSSAITIIKREVNGKFFYFFVNLNDVVLEKLTTMSSTKLGHHTVLQQTKR